MNWTTRWTLLIYVVGFWAGFWSSGLAWLNPFLALFGCLSGLGLLVVALLAIRERKSKTTDYQPNHSTEGKS